MVLEKSIIFYETAIYVVLYIITSSHYIHKTKCCEMIKDSKFWSQFSDESEEYQAEQERIELVSLFRSTRRKAVTNRYRSDGRSLPRLAIKIRIKRVKFNT